MGPPDFEGGGAPHHQDASHITYTKPLDEAGTPDSSGTGRQLRIPELTDDVDTLTAALAYADAGWYVLPTDPAKDIKNPGTVVGTRWQDKSSRDPEQIVAWFAGRNYGIALHAGRSGAVIFDVDDPDKLPDVLNGCFHWSPPRVSPDAPPWQAVGAGLSKLANLPPFQATRPDVPGRGHYIFLQPPGRTIGNGAGRLGGAWGEIRGLNGVIIAEPTPHPDGGRYKWRGRGRVPVLPDEIAGRVDDGSPAEDAASDAVVAAFLAEYQTASRPDVLNGLRATLIAKIEAGESVHMSAISVVTGAMKEARAGYYTPQHALDTLKPIFINAVALGGSTGKVRTGARAESEWGGIAAWAVAQALAANLDEVRARTEQKMPNGAENVTVTEPTPAPPLPLADAHTVFQRWLGSDYDTDALDAMLATTAVERFDDGSDPVWLLIVSGPGAAKTETVQSLDGIGAIIASSISSDAALLSATPKRERTKSATGGLLRKIGDRGVLVIKDVTSILSMNRDLRARVLAALREIYDGRWYRDVGSDGGQTIPWKGRIVVIGAVTTAWDTAHAVISTMGDRFTLIRIDSTTARQAAGRKAIGNTGAEPQMRAELAEAVAGVIAGMDPDPISISDAETALLLAAADLVTLARTGVEYDYRGDVIDAHAPEMPTRFAKQLTQIVRGGVAIGMDRADALRLAIRCARDSMPPLRLAIIDDLAAHPHSLTSDARRRLDKPRNTLDRQLQALHMLGVVAVDEQQDHVTGRVLWFYSLADGIDPGALTSKPVPEMSVHTPNPSEERDGGETAEPYVVTDISGTTPRRPGCIACADQPRPCHFCQLWADQRRDGAA